MAIKVPDVGEVNLMDILRAAMNGLGMRIRLNKNDKTPADADVLGDYTEADFSGYAVGVLGNMGFPSTAGGKAITVGDPVSFVHNGGATPNDIYGYYITDTAGTLLYWAERFTTPPINMSANGNRIIVTPQLTGKTEV